MKENLPTGESYDQTVGFLGIDCYIKCLTRHSQHTPHMKCGARLIEDTRKNPEFLLWVDRTHSKGLFPRGESPVSGECQPAWLQIMPV